MNYISIDPGHGGSDPGACGNNLKEAEINLAVSKKVKEIIEREYSDVTILLTRTTEKTQSLSEKSKIINEDAKKFGVKYALSIHCNSATPDAKGCEIFSYMTGGQAEKINKIIIEEYAKQTGLIKRRNNGHDTANFHMLRETTPPAGLIELAFISNPNEAQLLRQTDILARGIVNGLVRYFNLKKKVITPAPEKKEIFYRVCCGSYNSKPNAEAQQKKLKEKGFDSFLIAYEK